LKSHEYVQNPSHGQDVAQISMDDQAFLKITTFISVILYTQTPPFEMSAQSHIIRSKDWGYKPIHAWKGLIDTCRNQN